MADTCRVGSLVWDSLGERGSAISFSWTVCKFIILITFAVSTITSNYSQVDKLWSITPFVYAWILVVPGDTRTLLMALLATLWGCRLTYNFNRRGGYHWPPWSGSEDYRWGYLQKGFYIPALKNRWVWHVFNFLAISAYQNILLLLLVLPSMVANIVATNKHECFSKSTNTTLTLLDAIATALFLGFLTLESIADNTQFRFQTEKYRRIKLKEPLEGEYADGYCQSRVYAWVRKPNYTGEQGIWSAYYLFSVASLWSVDDFGWFNAVFNCSMLGCLLLILLFQGSGHFTELITISKYPSYTKYQERVPLYIPNLFKTSKETKAS